LWPLEGRLFIDVLEEGDNVKNGAIFFSAVEIQKSEDWFSNL